MTHSPAASDVIATRTLDPVDGFTLTAYEVPDTDSTPIGQSLDEGGCYTADDIEAWRRDEWQYVGVVVVASRAGVDLGSASIWGMDTGDYWDTITRDNGGTPYGVLDVVPGSVTTGHPREDGGIDYVTRDDFAHGYGADLISEALTEARATVAALTSPDVVIPVCDECGERADGVSDAHGVACSLFAGNVAGDPYEVPAPTFYPGAGGWHTEQRGTCTYHVATVAGGHRAAYVTLNDADEYVAGLYDTTDTPHVIGTFPTLFDGKRAADAARERGSVK
ncbi:hypothetical protein SEA_WHEEZY_85 [Gordonia phage Wheezy]|nr:hypothetical protein SEA_WHEEZY_85 [Gordonia phage Wheezy]